MIDNVFDMKFQPDAVLALMGSFPGRELFRKFSGVPLIAADGAGELLLDNGIEPDLIAGDIDSFGKCRYYKYFPKNKILTIEEQETNDFEKCLIYLSEKNYSKIAITGFNGGQLEHTLNNWCAYNKYTELFDLRLVEKDRIAASFSGGTCCKIQGKIDDQISIIPEPSAILTTKNLLFPLNHERLEVGYREGIHNRLSAPEGEITIHSGKALIFIPFKI